MSPDNLPSSSVRKSNTHFKSSKEDQNCPENGRISTSTQHPHPHPPSQQHQEQHQIGHNISTHISSSIHSHESGSPSRDVLLQWGQRKRSRCSRTEGRSMAEKHQSAIAMPPPLHPPSVASTSSNNGSRSGGTTRDRPNGLLYAKDGHGFLPSKNRSLADQMGCTNGASPSRNGNGSSRGISRSSIGKRSPSCLEKNDNKVSGSGSIRKVKSDDSLGNGNHHHHHHHHHQVELAEQENNNGGHHHHHHQGITMARSPVAEAEKGNGEVVEWPRIYISLSRKEKEDDFYAMKGTKLPHRPKKRAKAVDRALQYCFPGLWLSDLTRARYEVRERKSAKKPKRRGLKGLESMDSESE